MAHSFQESQLWRRTVDDASAGSVAHSGLASVRGARSSPGVVPGVPAGHERRFGSNVDGSSLLSWIKITAAMSLARRQSGCSAWTPDITPGTAVVFGTESARGVFEVRKSGY